MGEEGSITPPGQALRYCTEAQQQFCSKQAINRAIMLHVPEHLHSHLLTLLSLTAIDGNWIMQLVRIWNIFHSEQYVVGEDKLSSALTPCLQCFCNQTQNNSNHDFWSHSAWRYLAMLHLSASTHKPYVPIFVCIYTKYSLFSLLMS